jgi:transposase InsO family protein
MTKQQKMYTKEFKQEAVQLVSFGIILSMSGKGDCYDNALMESFFGTLKTECVDR